MEAAFPKPLLRPEPRLLVSNLLGNYRPEKGWDECFDSSGEVRPPYRELLRRIGAGGPALLRRAELCLQQFLKDEGVTFAVPMSQEGQERIFPLDLLPRILTREEWGWIERGLQQRMTALNLFLADIYGQAQIIRDGVLPEWLVQSSLEYRLQMREISPPKRVYVAVLGSDLIRDQDGRWLVLEDNLRVPSGASYMLANRAALKRALPEVMAAYNPQPVEQYPQLLWQTLAELAPPGVTDPQIAVFTPGPANSAYFEHAWLARTMGVPLVEGQDLEVTGGTLWIRSFGAKRPVHVLYRRVNDEFLDPRAFRADSLLGVPGLFELYRCGKVNLLNAIGTGVADDKAIYPWIPKIVRYYLEQEPMLPNVPTYLCSEPSDLKFVLEHLDELVIKEVNQSGGHGMLIGPLASASERLLFREKIRAFPRRYIAQPTVWFSQAPCYLKGLLVPRRVDLRPFVLQGDRIRVVPGGLSRVALQEGSLVVNSCQGGGSKDTWVTSS
ncbi:putative Glutamate--cysteine ligase [Candidatus Methylacidithermus pantelleriae]|uniref:Putative Glutamate--cysteine ligase n=2 Tax=Candidatus Methylacidithermus pantelleriae TaxID=2744239 RepID=A0A8J2BMG9_9BACT|nr:putative Glutamate--cysteine ligase [Candidatus Methylacidithermus pantelleriae]